MKTCIRCGENGVTTGLSGRLGLLCLPCKKANRAGRINQARDRRLKHKKTCCEHCGFVALHPCQLDVDHVDGNRDNDDPSNFRTLCANCHRLKTQLQKDHVPKDVVAASTPQLKLIK